jgi:hypothetical protein
MKSSRFSCPWGHITFTFTTEAETDAHIPLWILVLTGDLVAHLDIQYIGNPHTLTSMWITDLFTIQQTSCVLYLAHRAKDICDSNSLRYKQKFLHNTFWDNGNDVSVLKGFILRCTEVGHLHSWVPFKRANLNHWFEVHSLKHIQLSRCPSSLHLRTKTDQLLEHNVHFRMPDKGQSSKTQESK